MSNKKEIAVDVSAFGGALDGFKFFVQQVEYRSELLDAPTVHMKVLGVLDAAPVAVPTDIKLASDALKSAAEMKTVVPEGVSIHHDLERRFTIAYRISANGKLAFVGIAYCSPQDQFCRRTGRELAISRLNAPPSRTVRMPHPLIVSDGTYPKNGAEWRAVEQSILLGLGLLR